MEKINYITQLNSVFELFYRDERIKQGHITLYLAFFQKWNREYFKKTLTINRELIMERAKIKSKTTYHNYLKNLDEWGYLKYYPSYHPARGSKIKMFIFGTSPSTQQVQNLANSVPEPSQKMVPSYKHKTKKNFNKRHPVNFNEKEVILFFKKNNWEEVEARKFYAYIQSKNWKTKENWKKAAYVFVKNGFQMVNKNDNSPFSGYVNLLEKLKAKNDKESQ